MPSAKPSETDLSLIGPSPTSAPSSDAESLYRSELKAFDSPDQESDEEYERKIRRAFQVKQLEQFEEIIQSRKDYASKIFQLVVWWLVGLGVVVLMAGWEFEGFALDKTVLLALIGGTTLNVLGIFTIVTRFLFPKDGNTLLTLKDVLGTARPTPKTTARRSKPSEPRSAAPASTEE